MSSLATDVIDLAADVRAWLAGAPDAFAPGDGTAGAADPAAAGGDPFAREFGDRIADVVARLDAAGIPGTTSTGLVPLAERIDGYVRGDLRSRLVDHLMLMAADLGRRRPPSAVR